MKVIERPEIKKKLSKDSKGEYTLTIKWVGQEVRKLTKADIVQDYQGITQNLTQLKNRVEQLKVEPKQIETAIKEQEKNGDFIKPYAESINKELYELRVSKQAKINKENQAAIADDFKDKVLAIVREAPILKEAVDQEDLDAKFKAKVLAIVKEALKPIISEDE